MIQRHMTTAEILLALRHRLGSHAKQLTSDYFLQAAKLLREYDGYDGESNRYGLCWYLENRNLPWAYGIGDVMRQGLRPEADSLDWRRIMGTKGKTPERLATAAAWAEECEALAELVFKRWYDEVSEIAALEGLEPMVDAPAEEMQTWRDHYAAGLTPQQAWDATPYKKRW